jgi:hypothetical protein
MLICRVKEVIAGLSELEGATDYTRSEFDLLGGAARFDLLIACTRVGNLLAPLDRVDVPGIQKHLADMNERKSLKVMVRP